jgi:uncharacterized protein YndB with AHSA1/START domain
MNSMAAVKQGKKTKGITITRILNAPRSLVWKAWTDPELLKRWWGPKIFTAPVIKVDLRVGGKYLYAMRSPDGKDFWSTGTYREIVPYERIVVTDSFADEKGNVVPASYYGMTWDWPLEARVTSILEKERNGRTKFTLQYELTPPKEMLGPMVAGWNESIDKLEKVLEEEMARREKTTLMAEPGKQEAAVIRIFDAPREILFKAYTDPELMVRWWAPRRFSIIIEKLDVRPGGSWRILNRDKERKEFWFHGVYHEVSPNRIVYTFEFEGMRGHVLLGIVTFEEVNGKTKVMEKSVFESVADRDGMIAAGMEDGGYETMERLAELVENQKSP